MIPKIHRGTVDKGKFIPDDAQSWSIAFYRYNGKRVQVIIKRKTKKRSLSQNGYYRGVVLPLLCDYTGNTPDELHDALKWKFLRVIKDSGLETVRSTTELTTQDFEEYMTAIRQWASVEDYGYIPLPNEVDYASL